MPESQDATVCKAPVRYSEMPKNYNPEDPWALNLCPEHKLLAEALTNRFKQSEEPYVIAINGSWGTGKSLFLNMWKDDLEKQKIPCLHFNAWEYDYMENPLLAFITALGKQIKVSCYTKAKKACYGAINALAQEIPKIMGMMAQIGVNTQGVPFVGGTANNVTQKGAKKIIDFFVDIHDGRNKLTKSFENLVLEICKAYGNKTLFIMIDELDRCRPDFACNLLENIKHLFYVKNVIFILGVEKEQLGCCFGVRYGLNKDREQTYLHKFIDMTVELPKVPIEVFYKQCLKEYPIQNFSDGYDMSKVILTLLSKYTFTPRDIAQTMCRISLISYFPKMDNIDLFICAIICFNRQKNNNLHDCINIFTNNGHDFLRDLSIYNEDTNKDVKIYMFFYKTIIDMRNNIGKHNLSYNDNIPMELTNQAEGKTLNIQQYSKKISQYLELVENISNG